MINVFIDENLASSHTNIIDAMHQAKRFMEWGMAEIENILIKDEENEITYFDPDIPAEELT